MSPAADRLAAAEVRATTAYRSVGRKCDAVLEELEETTDPNGIVVTEVHEEDSIVTAIDTARAAANRR